MAAPDGTSNGNGRDLDLISQVLLSEDHSDQNELFLRFQTLYSDIKLHNL